MAIDQSTSRDTQQLVVFSVGPTEYALPISSVQEIIRYAAPQPTASPLPWLTGVIGLRGSIIPVVDLAIRLGTEFQGRVVDEKSKIVIIEGDDMLAGVIVNGVEEVLTVPLDHIEPVPSSSAPFIASIARIETRLIMLLDAQQLIGDL
ncbi:MAG: purine-binding chemotaxis protein CheW [Thermoleophilia bacterium]|nr:purine-binding chemotaxis protein CheW [Thermoleophilia bacterium]